MAEPRLVVARAVHGSEVLAACLLGHAQQILLAGAARCCGVEVSQLFHALVILRVVTITWRSSLKLGHLGHSLGLVGVAGFEQRLVGQARLCSRRFLREALQHTCDQPLDGVHRLRDATRLGERLCQRGQGRDVEFVGVPLGVGCRSNQRQQRLLGRSCITAEGSTEVACRLSSRRDAQCSEEAAKDALHFNWRRGQGRLRQVWCGCGSFRVRAVGSFWVAFSDPPGSCKHHTRARGQGLNSEALTCKSDSVRVGGQQDALQKLPRSILVPQH